MPHESIIRATVGVLLSGLILTAAFWVVALRNLFRATLSLGLVLVGVACVFLLLEAEFLAFVQILVYVGAILTLVVFAVMLTARLHISPATRVTHRQDSWLAGAAALALFGLLVWATQSLTFPQRLAVESVRLTAVGQQFITTLILPFEAISLIFVAAMVGAIALVTRQFPPSAEP